MKRTLLILPALALSSLLLTSCEETSTVTGPVAVDTVSDTTLDTSHAWHADTSLKDTVTVVYPTLFPKTDSLRFLFVDTATRDTGRWTRAPQSSKDTILKLPLDTGTGRIWRLGVTGLKGGKIWWQLDSIRVVPDSSRRIVLDSFYKKIKVADTASSTSDTDTASDDTISAAETIPYSSLTGVPTITEGSEEGVFIYVDGGTLYIKVNSNGNDQATYDNVFAAALRMGFKGGTVGSYSLIDKYDGPRDNDSTSRGSYSLNSSNSISDVNAKIFARYRTKTLSLTVVGDTVTVQTDLFRGTQTTTSGWTMSSISGTNVPKLICFGSKKVHPSSSSFRFIIP